MSRTIVILAFATLGCGSTMRVATSTNSLPTELSELQSIRTSSEEPVRHDCDQFVGVTGEDRGNVTLLARANADFSFSLLREIKWTHGNAFFSPYSISTALAMTFGGARTNTAAEMATALRFNLEPAQLHRAFGNLAKSLECLPDKAYELTTANALWGQSGYSFRNSFLRQAVTIYDSPFRQLDFAGSPETARDTINQWAAKATNDRVKDLVPSGSLSATTKLLLTNAIYYKATWLHAFDESSTKERNFLVAPELAVKVPMMRQTRNVLYAETDDVEVLDLPFLAENNSGNSRQSLMIFLPKASSGMVPFADLMSSAKLHELRERLEYRYVTVTLPKFKFASEISLKEVLQKLGMNEAFSVNKADFTGMYEPGAEPLYLDEVLHKAYIDLNEKGVEAAGATAAQVASYSVLPDPIPFTADHPFFFLVWDEETSSVLFLGRLSDPR